MAGGATASLATLALAGLGSAAAAAGAHGPSGAEAGAGQDGGERAGTLAAPNGGAPKAAFSVFQQRVREFNACVPYAGVSPGAPFLKRGLFAKRGLLLRLWQPGI